MTRGEESQGSFQVESVFRIKPGKHKPSTTFGLGSAVFAGNMYVKNELVKNPPYLFQIAGNSEKQIIYRTYLHDRFPDEMTHEGRMDDTIDLKRKRFKSFE